MNMADNLSFQREDIENYNQIEEMYFQKDAHAFIMKHTPKHHGKYCAA